MLESISLKSIFFLDIETVPQSPSFGQLDETMQKLWEYRIHRFKPEEAPLADYYFEKAGVYAEFGKTICISLGFFAANPETGDEQFRVKSFYSHDEKQLLTDFLTLLSRYTDASDRYICGHNIKEFDIPFLCRRAMVLGLPIPKILDTTTARPWEIKHIDTMHLWRFGDYRNYTSLHLLTTVLGIPSPKNDMEGSEVAAVYWNTQNIERISQYCQADVVAIARIMQHFKQQNTLTNEQIIYVK
ncbi:MAG: 3'-5' exonuclease [Chitinophagales bacterium]|jgi:DNA polymerase elongation subunit (family B)|nr:3'-5' exonuclease [Chitinophagales bacterium]